MIKLLSILFVIYNVQGAVVNINKLIDAKVMFYTLSYGAEHSVVGN